MMGESMQASGLSLKPSGWRMHVAPVSLVCYRSRMSRLVSAAVLCLCFFAPALGQESRARVDVSKLGPQVGERVPDFRLTDQAGTIQTLDSIAGPRGAMIVFVRSAEW